MKYILLILLSAIQARADVKPLMQNFYNLTERLQPYLIDKNAFMNPKNEKEIAAVLGEFNQNTKNLKKDKMAEGDDMKFRVRLLTEDLDEAESSFKNGFKDYSYWALKSSLNNCLSCHTQKSLPITGYKLKDDSGTDPFSKAEFLFIFRNYPEALALYEDILTYYPANKAPVENIETAAQKILFFSIRVSRDDSAAITVFNRILKNAELPSDLRFNILAWNKYLGLRKYRIDEQLPVKTVKDVEAFMRRRETIAKEYSRPRQRTAADLDTAHFLFKLLETNDNKKLRPVVLYNLARIESDYRTNFFDLTSDNYLKECIEKYPKERIAKKCFDLYKELQILSYTGSRGTDLPLSVVRQLEKYESMVKQK